MTPRKRVYWFDENDGPRTGWVDLEHEWDDPLPDEVEEDRIETLATTLDTLTAKQRFVIERNWGVFGYEPTSFVELGQLMGVSTEAVKRIYDRGMNKLQESA